MRDRSSGGQGTSVGLRRNPLQLRRERLALLGLLVAVFVLRAANIHQPIVENYVGRQIPTAMVARNLDRGSGFLYPELDTGPFPNLFLIEPPVYAWFVVALHRLARISLEPAGRLVSALATVLGAWGLFGLAKRREGSVAAFSAVAAFAIFPITIRYGRAFQPDAMMLGALVAGLRCWDEHEQGGSRRWLAAGCALLAAALAVKVVAAYVLLPLIVVILRPPRRAKIILALTMLAPALLWYAHAALLLRGGSTSGAMTENVVTWVRALVPSALVRPEAYANYGRFLILRAFTPLGFALAVLGWCRTRAADRLWAVWGVSVAGALAVLAGKLHHEYYWLAVAPLAAIGVGRGLGDVWERGASGRLAFAVVWVGLLALSSAQSASTWRTPREWAALSDAAAEVGAHVPEDELLIAPEALLYYANRRGYRLEVEPAGVDRALRELGIKPGGRLLKETQQSELLSVYSARGAEFLADLAGNREDPRRRLLHETIRSRSDLWEVLVDRPGVVLIARKHVRPSVFPQRPSGQRRTSDVD